MVTSLSVKFPRPPRKRQAKQLEASATMSRTGRVKVDGLLCREHNLKSQNHTFLLICPWDHLSDFLSFKYQEATTESENGKHKKFLYSKFKKKRG